MIDISPVLLFSTLGVFLALIVVLNGMVYKPLLSFMEKRDEDIKRDLSKAGTNSSEIEELLQKAEDIVQKAKMEAVALREKVVADAKELAASRIEAKKAALANEFAEFEENLKTTKEELRGELVKSLPAFQEALNSKFKNI